jgi:hypothetical protein
MLSNGTLTATGIVPDPGSFFTIPGFGTINSPITDNSYVDAKRFYLIKLLNSLEGRRLRAFF